MKMSVYSPFVFWAQNETNIFLKVDLKNVTETNINLEPRKLQFQSKGVGARGLNEYAFEIDFHLDIDPTKSTHKITDNRVDFNLIKLDKGWWPRLLLQTQKPVWLKIDHDRFQFEDMDEEVADILQDYPNLYEKLQREEFGYKKGCIKSNEYFINISNAEDFKKVYLTIYNLFMFVGFMYVMCVLCVRYIRDGPGSLHGTYAAVGNAVCFLQLIQMLEIMHPMFGYVKGRVLIPSMQIIGRVFITVFLIEREPRIQVMPVIFYLFIAWASIEIVRYPYYLSQLLKRENGLLTWLRYTVWMFSYPVGAVCEGVIIFRTIVFMEQDQSWQVNFPSLAITLKFVYFLRIYLLCLFIPGTLFIMTHLRKARKRKLGPFSPKKNKVKKQN